MTVKISGDLSRPILACIQKQPACYTPTGTTLLHIPHSYARRRLVLRKSMVQQQSPTESVDVGRLVQFLNDDLPHLFDEQGIDRSMYDERIQFRDPITKYDTIAGYLFNIKMFKLLFQPEFQLHSAKQTGPYEITTRWTMVMKFVLLPWKPELVFTGISIMGINPQTQKFCSHVDNWDSIDNNEYFSPEGLVDFLKQLRIYKTPDMGTPKYQILKRTANYEVRKYAPFLAVASKGDKLSGFSGFNKIIRYIFGKMPMTTLVFTQVSDGNFSEVPPHIVLPLDKDLNSLPALNGEEVRIRKAEGSIAAVKKFSGKPTEDMVRIKEKELRTALLKDGLKPEKGCLLAQYNYSAFVMRNEVLLWLNDFTLE